MVRSPAAMAAIDSLAEPASGTVTLALYKGNLYLGTLDGRLIALNARTGAPVWDVMTIDPSKPYAITGAPRIAIRLTRMAFAASAT